MEQFHKDCPSKQPNTSSCSVRQSLRRNKTASLTLIHWWKVRLIPVVVRISYPFFCRNHLLILISGYIDRLTHQLAPKSFRKLNYLSPLHLMVASSVSLKVSVKVFKRWMEIVAPFFVGTFPPFSPCLYFLIWTNILPLKCWAITHMSWHTSNWHMICFSLVHPVYYYRFQSNLPNLNPCSYNLYSTVSRFYWLIEWSN